MQLGFLSVLTNGRSPEEFWAAARNSKLREDSTQQRRALAEWITDLEHGPGALLARVIVNRVWQHHFGEGLVRTESDFGVQAEPPIHPELLEWLSAEFVRSGWRLKALHRLLMTSAVYLQESIPDPAKARADPENRWLSRRRPQRLEAEILRDSVLAVSGRLNPQAYGPAFKAPILPEAIQARNLKTPYPTGLADSTETHRRTVYMFHKRVVQHPLMQAFDAPDAQASCGRRNRTTVAPQALALLNDQFIRARAVDFASRLEREAGAALPAQVTRAFQLALGREPEETEQNKAVGFLRSQADRRRGREEPGAAAAHLALVDFCQTIFALNEFIYVD